MVAETVRRRAPDERPQQILEAALAEFGEQGLAGARLDDIARRAGVAKGTIYLYFPNKEELFREVVRQTIVARLTDMEQEFGHGGPGTATDQLRAYLRTWWAALKSPAFRTVYRLVVGELHRFPELLAFYLEEVKIRSHAMHVGVLERGVATGEFDVDDPAATARIISAMFITHSLWVCSPLPPMALVGDLGDDLVFAQLEAFALRALRPGAGPDVRSHVAPAGATADGPTPDASRVPTA